MHADESQQSPLQARHPVVITCLSERADLSIDPPDKDGHYCVTFATEDGDHMAWFLPEEIKRLGAWLNGE